MLRLKHCLMPPHRETNSADDDEAGVDDRREVRAQAPHLIGVGLRVYQHRDKHVPCTLQKLCPTPKLQVGQFSLRHHQTPHTRHAKFPRP